MYIYHVLHQAKVLDRKRVVFLCHDPEKCTNEHFSSWQVAKAAVTRERIESLPNMAALKVFALNPLPVGRMGGIPPFDFFQILS
jgi:hypothetical protein